MWVIEVSQQRRPHIWDVDEVLRASGKQGSDCRIVAYLEEKKTIVTYRGCLQKTQSKQLNKEISSKRTKGGTRLRRGWKNGNCQC